LLDAIGELIEGVIEDDVSAVHRRYHESEERRHRREPELTPPCRHGEVMVTVPLFVYVCMEPPRRHWG
jgi:hypothetical protein